MNSYDVFFFRLRELELAPTPEQKREVLRLFKLESELVVEHQYDYIVKIIQGFLREDRITNFLNIRKGKVRFFIFAYSYV